MLSDCVICSNHFFFVHIVFLLILSSVCCEVLPQLLKKCLSAELDTRHGATVALAFLLQALNQLHSTSSPARLYLCFFFCFTVSFNFIVCLLPLMNWFDTMASCNLLWFVVVANCSVCNVWNLVGSCLTSLIFLHSKTCFHSHQRFHCFYIYKPCKHR